jgi:hypothetical protein
VRPGINSDRVDLAQLLATPLYDANLSADDVDRLIERTVRCNGWLVFYTHDVARKPTDQGSSPNLLAHAVGSAERAGCDVLTIADALPRIGGC